MFALAVLSWTVWLVVFLTSLNDKDSEHGIPYPVMLGWFIVNVAMTGA